jgi:hypothetical protein
MRDGTVHSRHLGLAGSFALATDGRIPVVVTPTDEVIEAGLVTGFARWLHAREYRLAFAVAVTDDGEPAVMAFDPDDRNHGCYVVLTDPDRSGWGYLPMVAPAEGELPVVESQPAPSIAEAERWARLRERIEGRDPADPG